MKIYRNKKSSAPATDVATPATTEDTSAETPVEARKSKKAANPATEAEPSGEMVTIIKTGAAAKLSPRGDGQLSYQVGRIGEAVHFRIFHNESAGRFSKEWVAVGSIRKALANLPKNEPLFKPAIGLKPAWTGQSACNSGFGAAILKAEGVLVPDAEKNGMMRLASMDALDKWEQAMLALKVPKDAEKVPLHPPKLVPKPGPRRKNPGTDADGAGEEDARDETLEKSHREDEGTEADGAESEAESNSESTASAKLDAPPESGEES